MEVMRRMAKSKQYMELVKPLFIFDFPSRPACFSQWRNCYYGLSRSDRCACASGYNGTYYGTCIKLLEAYSDGTYIDNPWKSQQKPPTPTPIPTSALTIDSSDDAECIYNRMFTSIIREEEMPAGMLLAMIQRCRTYYDINLLIFFLEQQELQFRLRKNLDAHLTEEITRACLRCGALLYAQMTLCRANTYGFTPNIGSALLFLNYAQDHDDIELTEKTIRLMRINNWPLGPDAAEIILKIYRKETITEGCLFIRTARSFISTGVKLHQSSLEMSMELAANIGDADSVRDFERARSQVMTRYTCKSGFAYAKSFLLDCKPEEAAKVIIELLHQYLPVVDDDPRIIHDIEYYRRKGESWPDELMIEIQKMVKEWPAKIVKIRISHKIRKERIAIFKSCIPKMVEYLSTKGFELKLDVDHLNQLGNSL